MEKIFKNDSKKKITRDDLIYSLSFYLRLKKIILEDVEPPFSISLEGEWGTGKTFMLKLLMNELTIEEEYTCIWFNPWLYEKNDDVFLAFLQKLSKEFSAHKFKDIINQFGIFSLSLFVCGLDTVAKIISKGNLSYKSIKEISTDIDESFAKTFEEYEDIQSRIKRDFVSITNDVFKFNNKPVIIFFDDLDRCLPENTLDLIESLKNYFNVKDAKAIFVFGQNPKITRDFIKQRYQHISDNFVNDYYKKVFDFCVNLPQLTTDSTQVYLERKLEDEECGKIIVSNDFKSALIQRNLDFRNKSLRVIDKVIFNVIFFSDYLNKIDLDFLVFWHFSQEVKPVYHDMMIKSLLSNGLKTFAEVSDEFDILADNNFEKKLYKDFIQKYNYVDINLLVESLLCVK